MAFHTPNHSGEEDADLADINIIPLVDVMLVLLIIFMVTAPLSIGGIKVSLPYSKAKGGKVDDERIVLSINEKGEYYLEKLNISGDKLEEKMRAIYEFRENKNLYIRADRGVPYGRVVDAMSAAKIAGVTKLSMLTQPPQRKSAHVR